MGILRVLGRIAAGAATTVIVGAARAVTSSSKPHRPRNIPRGKDAKIKRWKDDKKASGKWLPHDEYVKQKRGR